MSRFFLFLQILLLGVILAPSSLNAQKGDQQLKRKFSNESTRIRIPISSANSDLNNQEVFQTKWINNSHSEILDIIIKKKSVEKEGILYPSQQMMDRIWLTLLASVDPIADSSGGDDTGGGDNAKRGLVPLPKPDSNPNGAGPDDVLKISDEAACVAKGGVWVSRGDTGFCYLKIKAEEPPELEPIDDNDSGGPAWNNGSNNNLFEGNLQRSSDSSGGGDSGPLGATSRTTQIEYGLIAALMSVEGGVTPLKSSASALVVNDVGRDLTRRENAELQNLIDTLSSSQVTQALTAGEHAVGTDVIILSRRHGTGGVEAVVLVNCQ